MPSATGKERISLVCDSYSTASASQRKTTRIRYVQAIVTSDPGIIGMTNIYWDSPNVRQLDMQDGDTLEVHQEQIGGC